MIRKTFAAGALCLLGSSATGAEVSFVGFNELNQPLISISGRFVEGDVERFSNAVSAAMAAQSDSAMQSDDGPQTPIVIFESPGGNLDVGIELGNRIRLRGFVTAVADNTECHSACALAWLGGVQRYIGEDALVTFHAAYRLEDGRPFEDGLGNALVGSYAANLGLNRDAVIFLTSAPPEGFNSLTPRWARNIGLPVIFGMTEPMMRLRQETDEWWKSAPLVETEQDGNGSDNPESDDPAVDDAVPGIAANETDFETLLEAAIGGDPEAHYLVLKYDKGNDVQATVHWYRVAAEKGYARAQSVTGFLYYVGLVGLGVPQDHAEATRWFRKAAEQGETYAQANLGGMFFLGQGVTADYTEAFRWLRLAAEQGHAGAQAGLGFLYSEGHGVLQDYDIALRWYRAAAEQGHAGAQNNIGFLYFEGRGVPQDYISAYVWINIAAANGDAHAHENREIAARQMTDDAIAEAQRRARVCMASNYQDCD